MSSGAGTGWTEVRGEISVMRRDARIYLAGPLHEQLVGSILFPVAYIQGLLRVRITATIEGDAVCDSGNVLSGVSLSNRILGQVSVRRGDALVRTREDLPATETVDGKLFPGGNSRFRGGSQMAAKRNDARAERQTLTARVRRTNRVRHRGFVERPEIVVPGGTDEAAVMIRPGDTVEGLVSEDNDALYSTPLEANADGDYAIVGAIEWAWKQGGGGQAPAYATRYEIEDVDRWIK
jgi:hypothetical protein